MEQNALEMIARRYRDEGYDIIVNPLREQIPPFLAGYHVDLLARRGNEGVVVEIKTNRFDLPHTTQITQLAEIVNAQPGWRLDFIVLEPETPFEKAAQDASEPSDLQLAEILNAAEEMADKGYAPYACVIAWSGLEAAMRRVGDEGEFHGRTTPTELIRTLYGNGVFSRDQFERLRDSYKIRSQVVHGLVPPEVNPEMVRFVTAAARSIASGVEVARRS